MKDNGRIRADIKFLDEIKQNGIKWAEGNDACARDMFYKLIEDWKDELKELLCE